MERQRFSSATITEVAMKILIILNDAPYGTERSYNALRIAQSLIKHHHSEVT